MVVTVDGMWWGHFELKLKWPARTMQQLADEYGVSKSAISREFAK